MICFELELNGKRLATAGIPGAAVLAAGLTWVQSRPTATTPKARTRLVLNLGGLESNDPATDGTHVDWIDKHLKVGDRVSIRVVEGTHPDPPVSRKDSMIDEELGADRVRSAHHYLRQYKKQRVALDRQIRVIEHAIAAAKPKKKSSRRTGSNKR